MAIFTDRVREMLDAMWQKVNSNIRNAHTKYVSIPLNRVLQYNGRHYYRHCFNPKQIAYYTYIPKTPSSSSSTSAHHRHQQRTTTTQTLVSLSSKCKRFTLKALKWFYSISTLNSYNNTDANVLHMRLTNGCVCAIVGV